jgi:hypothetical protein
MTHPAFGINGAGFSGMKLGKKPRKEHPRTLKLANYLDLAALPTPPTKVVWGSKVTSYGIDGNDQYGDCTCAAAAHMVETWTSEAGKFFSPSQQDTMTLYWETGDPPNQPCEPGGPTDDGRYCTGVLAELQTVGIAGHQILGWAEIDLAVQEQRDAGNWLFGGNYLGIALPLSAQNQTVWSVVGSPADVQNPDSPSYPGSWGGHCVPTVARWPNTWEIVTWGARLEMTEAFFTTYVDEAYVCVTQDWIDAQGASPVPGVNLAQLQADLKQFTGTSGP